MLQQAILANVVLKVEMSLPGQLSPQAGHISLKYRIITSLAWFKVILKAYLYKKSSIKKSRKYSMRFLNHIKYIYKLLKFPRQILVTDRDTTNPNKIFRAHKNLYKNFKKLDIALEKWEKYP